MTMTMTIASTKNVPFAGIVALLFFATVLPSVESTGFLKPQAMTLEKIQQELEAALADAMGHGHGMADEAKMEARKARLGPMFDSMPKNMGGFVNRGAVHYMLHRYFGAVHGWSIRGFESHDLARKENVSDMGTARILREKLPEYVEDVLENRLDHDGFSLHDLVVMVTVMERMIVDESVEMLEAAYYLNDVDYVVPMNEEKLHRVMESFMMVFAFKSQRVNRTRHELVRNYLRESRGPAGWPSGNFGRAETTAMIEDLKRENPFKEHSYNFETSMRAVTNVAEGYGQWTNEEECLALKNGLVELDKDGNGRVRLHDFYAKARVGKTWYFDESQAYLRAQGVLDESSTFKGPQLLVANYVQSLANCVDVSGFYSACCRKECEAVMDTIERAVREPMATPERLVEIVQDIIHVHEEDPRNLTKQHLAQLESVVDHHGHGRKIPIHGRLFQQWLHYVFPQECPYPNLIEKVEAKLSKEWAKNTGQNRKITQEEYEQHLEMKKRVDAEEEVYLQQSGAPTAATDVNATQDMSHWTFEEELYVGHHHEGPRVVRSSRGASASSFFGSMMRAGVLLGGVMTLGFMVRKGLASGGKPKVEPCTMGVSDVFV